MKITAIEIKHYLLPLDPPFKAAWDPSPRKTFAATIVRIKTDEGLTGIGSGDLMVGFAGHEHLFIGRDPFDMESHWQVLDSGSRVGILQFLKKQRLQRSGQVDR